MAEKLHMTELAYYSTFQTFFFFINPTPTPAHPHDNKCELTELMCSCEGSLQAVVLDH